MKWAVGVKWWAYRIPGGHRVDMQSPRVGVQGPRGSIGRFDGSSDDLEGLKAYV